MVGLAIWGLAGAGTIALALRELYTS